MILASHFSVCQAQQDPSAAAAVPREAALAALGPQADSFPDLSLPANANLESLDGLIERAKSAQPRSPQQYQVMQTAIRDASRQVMHLLGGKVEHPRYQQAELDAISSAVALMTFFGEDAKQKTLLQVHRFLKSRKQLSLPDVQTGIMASAMLELQPNKKPARDTYQLLYDLLEDDQREEMQRVRLNLQASMRRLDLLGKKFDLAAVSLSGQKVRIDDYAGKFVIVNFFASWCEPCLSDIPQLQKSYEKYNSKGLEIIGISLDTEVRQLEEFLQGSKFSWPVIHDNADDPLERLQMKFGVLHLPTVLLLDKQGIVVSLEARGAELDRLMELLFESPTPAAPLSGP